MNLIIPTEIENYCEAHTTAESDLLYQLNRETHLKMVRPRMLTGKLQGAFLTLLSTLIKPKFILEIGTFTGYATLCLAEGVQDGGALHTIEINEEQEDIIRKYINLSPFKERIQLHIGDALKIIPTLPYSWDLIFLDAEKKDNLLFYQMLIDNMHSGGLLIVDNVLWSGKVVEKIDDKDKDTLAIKTFNDIVHQDERVTNLMLPLRDGLMIIQKK